MTQTDQQADPFGNPRDAAAEARCAVVVNRGEIVREGMGVRNIVAIGGNALPDFDPFLLFAEFGGAGPEDYAGGFPSHPHRGFETLTYVLEGRLKHADSAGTSGRLGPGAVQRMKAARGIIHAEMPDQTDGRLRAVQIWLNLPAIRKMDAPAYQDVAAEMIPEIVVDGVAIKVLVGAAFGTASPIAGGATDLLFLDVALPGGSTLGIPLRHGHAAFAYVADGSIRIAGKRAVREDAAFLSDGGQVTLSSPEGGRALVLSARPLNEPVARRGPFVMNTRQELTQAMADYQAGRLAV